MESGDQPVISDIGVIRGQSQQAPATFSQSEAGRVEIKTSCVGANKWSVVNSVLAEAPPHGLCDHMTRDILKCPGTIVPPHWSVIFAIKWRYEGSSWRAANLFPIIIVTNVTESTSNIFFYLLIRYFLSPVTIDRGKDPKRAGSAVMFLSNFSRVIEMFNLHQSLTQSSKPSARLSPI